MEGERNGRPASLLQAVRHRGYCIEVLLTVWYQTTAMLTCQEC